MPKVDLSLDELHESFRFQKPQTAREGEFDEKSLDRLGVGVIVVGSLNPGRELLDDPSCRFRTVSG